MGSKPYPRWRAAEHIREYSHSELDARCRKLEASLFQIRSIAGVGDDVNLTLAQSDLRGITRIVDDLKLQIAPFQAADYLIQELAATID